MHLSYFFIGVNMPDGRLRIRESRGICLGVRVITLVTSRCISHISSCGQLLGGFDIGIEVRNWNDGMKHVCLMSDWKGGHLSEALRCLDPWSTYCHGENGVSSSSYCVLKAVK